MDHLSPDQVDELRRQLASELDDLERSMAVTEEAVRPVELDQTAVGRLSRMDSLQNQGLAKNLEEREQIKLARIEAAYRRLADGSYGRCTECEGEIPFGRLTVFPETATCQACG